MRTYQRNCFTFCSTKPCARASFPWQIRRHLSGLRLLALLAGLSPMTAASAEDFLICKDPDGTTAYVRIYYAEKKVTMITGESPSRCISTFVNGAYGPVLGSPPGETCVILAFNGGAQDSAHQSVTFAGHTVTTHIDTPNAHLTYVLNTETGIYDLPSGDIEECHRPHA